MIDIETALNKLGLETKRHGRRVWTELCPLPTHGKHNLKHTWANFNMVCEGPKQGVWGCYSCGRRGHLVDLVMLVQGWNYRQSIEWIRTLEEQAPVKPFLKVKVAGPPPKFSFPDGVEFAPLQLWNSVPRDYVLARGITSLQVERWRIGYSLIGRCAGRIVIPIFDIRGRLASYTARTFVDDEVRYLNAAEWEHPDTSRFWGEHRWGGRTDAVLVCEGAINGLALERAAEPGFPLAGLSGSNFDHRQALRLSCFKRIIVATDPDAAGEKAYRLIEGAFSRSPQQVVRMQYPGSEDADKTDPAALSRAIDGACKHIASDGG